MRHRNTGRILKREKGPRTALLKSLMRSVVLRHAIVTTEAKAKEVRPKLEKLVTRVRTGTLAGHRYAASQVGVDGAKHIKEKIVPLVKERKGGYLRITKYGVRKSDASRMARIGFVDALK